MVWGRRVVVITCMGITATSVPIIITTLLIHPPMGRVTANRAVVTTVPGYLPRTFSPIRTVAVGGLIKVVRVRAIRHHQLE